MRPQPGRHVATEVERRAPRRLQGGEEAKIGIGLAGERPPGGRRIGLQGAFGAHRRTRVQRRKGGDALAGSAEVPILWEEPQPAIAARAVASRSAVASPRGRWPEWIDMGGDRGAGWLGTVRLVDATDGQR